ncbi:unnamed protein product [Peniophora sp. CBMAI 1063]|nr:unnamed protein product [Peniophora sp. CBMAI 1063]
MLQYERPSQHHFDYSPAMIHGHYYDSPSQPRPDTAGSTASSGWDHISPVDSPTSPTFAYAAHPNLVLPSPADVAHDPHDDANKTYSFVSLPGNAVKKRPRRRYDEIERLYSCNWPDCTKAYGTLNHLNAHINMQRHGPKRTPAEFKDMRKQWRKAKKEEAERAARLHSAANGSAPGFPLSAAAEHSSHAHHHHHLAQHSSLPDLHQQAHYPGHGHSHSLSFTPAYHNQQPMYRTMPPQQLQSIEEYGQPLRRHSMHTVASLSGFPPPHPQAPPPPPQHFAGVHTLQHSLSNASLSSTSHSLSPPHEYTEPPQQQQQQPGSYSSGWMSRAETQGWDSQPQPQYSYEAHHGQPPSVYEQPRSMYGDTRGSLAPDSTLLTPLDVPGYAPAVHHDDR